MAPGPPCPPPPPPRPLLAHPACGPDRPPPRSGAPPPLPGLRRHTLLPARTQAPQAPPSSCSCSSPPARQPPPPPRGQGRKTSSSIAGPGGEGARPAGRAGSWNRGRVERSRVKRKGGRAGDRGYPDERRVGRARPLLPGRTRHALVQGEGSRRDQGQYGVWHVRSSSVCCGTVLLGGGARDGDVDQKVVPGGEAASERPARQARGLAVDQLEPKKTYTSQGSRSPREGSLPHAPGAASFSTTWAQTAQLPSGGTRTKPVSRSVARARVWVTRRSSLPSQAVQQVTPSHLGPTLKGIPICPLYSRCIPLTLPATP